MLVCTVQINKRNFFLPLIFSIASVSAQSAGQAEEDKPRTVFDATYVAAYVNSTQTVGDDRGRRRPDTCVSHQSICPCLWFLWKSENIHLFDVVDTIPNA